MSPGGLKQLGSDLSTAASVLHTKQNPPTVTIDAQLRHFYAADSSERDLEALLAGLRPYVRRLLRKGAIPPEEMEDLTAEAIRRLLLALRRSRESGAARILDAAGYASTVAQHVLIDHIHHGRIWRRWKRRIVEVLDDR